MKQKASIEMLLRILKLLKKKIKIRKCNNICRKLNKKEIFLFFKKI